MPKTRPMTGFYKDAKTWPGKLRTTSVSVQLNKSRNHAKRVLLQSLPRERRPFHTATKARVRDAGEREHVLAHAVLQDVDNIASGGVLPPGEALAMEVLR